MSRDGRSTSSDEGTEFTCARTGECSGFSSSMTNMSMLPAPSRVLSSCVESSIFTSPGRERHRSCPSVRLVGPRKRYNPPSAGMVPIFSHLGVLQEPNDTPVGLAKGIRRARYRCRSDNHLVHSLGHLCLTHECQCVTRCVTLA